MSLPAWSSHRAAGFAFGAAWAAAGAACANSSGALVQVCEPHRIFSMQPEIASSLALARLIETS